MQRLGLSIVLVATLTAARPPAADCRSTLKSLVARARLSEQASLRVFYEPTAYAPAWIRDGRPTPQAEAMIETLRTAAAQGLRAEDYDASRLEGQLMALKHSSLDQAQFDLALSLSAMRYVSDRHFGRVDPRSIHSGFDLEHEKVEVPNFIRAHLVEARDVTAALAEIDPPFPGYRRTERALQRYLVLAAEDDGETLPVTAKPVEPGSFYAAAGQLGRKLWALGDLPNAVECGDRYEGPLVEAVKRFQVRHGLDPDGRIGASTWRQLNMPLSRRVRQLELTLERYRWAPHRFRHPPIVVNIPEFRLRAMNSSYATELEMKVVVGRAYRTRTPVFADEMQLVVFRPYWDVPPSIQQDELLPRIARDTSYLVRHGYEVVAATDNVPRKGAVTPDLLAQLRSGKLRIRQVPGPQNALGLVKFLFPNRYNVYMHDTPATELFSRSRRDFSHGCIRVERPEALAAWVLKDQRAWTPARIAEVMNADSTITVALAKPIPVLIVYATAVAMENGDVHFFEDIYGHDAALEKALTSGARGLHPRE